MRAGLIANSRYENILQNTLVVANNGVGAISSRQNRDVPGMAAQKVTVHLLR